MNQKTTFHYVLKNNYGNYWGGQNYWVDQIRKATMYNSLKKAQEAADYYTKKHNDSVKEDCKISSIEILKIQITEASVVEKITY